MYVIAVELTVEPENAGPFRERISKHAENSRKEEGCVRFDVAEDEKQAGRFLVWEIYQDRAAFEVHTQAPYLAEFREAIDPILTSQNLTTLNLLT